MTQQQVMKAWEDWMRDSGLSEQAIAWFMDRGYDACCYLFDCVYELRI